MFQKPNGIERFRMNMETIIILIMVAFTANWSTPFDKARQVA